MAAQKQTQTQDIPKQEEFVIPQDNLESIASYLMQRPWHEANPLIAKITNLQTLETRIKKGPQKVTPPVDTQPKGKEGQSTSPPKDGSKKKSSKKNAKKKKITRNGAASAGAK